MDKILFKGLIIVGLFFLTWTVLRQIDYVTLFKIEESTKKLEEKLDDLFWQAIEREETIIDQAAITNTLDSIITKICNKNQIDRSTIKAHIVLKDEVNAFALPNGHLIVYSGLITASENQEELSGVVCHEIAHIQLKHVMKKLLKEIGIGVLVSITTGNKTGKTINQVLKILSSSAFDRSLEKEADLKAVEYLSNAKINPEPFANFLYKLAEKTDATAENLAWISTHPASQERAEYIIDAIKTKKTYYQPVVSKETWSSLKKKIAHLEESVYAN